MKPSPFIFLCFLLYGLVLSPVGSPLLGQEVRMKMEAQHRFHRGAKLGMGLELRESGALPIPPGTILIQARACYPLSSTWKVGSTLRGAFEREDAGAENPFMKERNRSTLDGIFCHPFPERKSEFQLRLRYQYAWWKHHHEHQGRIRLKWELGSMEPFRPSAGLELRYKGFHPVPDALRIRMGMETRLSSSTRCSLYYQCTLGLKDDHEIMEFALGTCIKFQSK